MARRIILKGDKTDRNGEVLEGVATSMFEGRPIAYHGAPVFCHTCNTQGVIVGDGPSLPMTFMGKQLALENDICKCKCEPPPRLVASQHQASISV
ncbi:PAAR domain-containing protein [Paraburkholderia sediminicola]|uniref:PAAR domain-containing protein n=1 Tax=Paraburkholderia sediminicola TaxID=458836 RepID=UPI0038BC7132